MAIIAGGSTGLNLAWNTDLDNASDRILALQDQHGEASAWTANSGTIERISVGLEAIEIEVDQNKFTDGVTNGTNTLTSASNPFSAGMVNESIEIEGFGTRVVSSYIGPGSITFSGSSIASGSGRTFRTPLGIAGGEREIEGTAGYPLAARDVETTEVQSVVSWLVGRKKQG